MYLCFRKLQDWRVNVKNVFVIQSLFLFLVLIFPTSVEARDYHIQASDGEVYTITVGEDANVDNFSIKRLNEEILQGVTEEERVIAAELYFAARLLWIVRTHYSPNTQIYDWVEGVTVIGEDAFNKLLSRQIATTVGNISADIAVALSTAGIATKAAGAVKEISSDAIWKIIVEEISSDAMWKINGELANHLEQTLLLDAYFVALATAAEALKYENLLRQTWQSTETQSRIISIDEINAAWENFYKMGDYQLLTSDLINKYLGVPDLSERLSDFFISFLPVIADLATLESIEYSTQHLQEVHNLKKNSDTEIHQRALEEIAEGKKEARTTLEQASFFMPLQDQSPITVGAIRPIVMEVGDVPKPVEVSAYFSHSSTLKYKALSNPRGIVAESISDSRVIITPVAAGVTTVLVTAYDENNTDLTATQTISVAVGFPSPVIDHPDSPPFVVLGDNNPRSEGLREGVSVITQNLAKPFNVRKEAELGDNIEEQIGNGLTGIIKDGPRENDTYTWWYIEWDSINLEGWSAEFVEHVDGGGRRVKVLLRRPPDLEIRDLDVSDDKVAPGEEFELQVEIRNNGPGDSAATEISFYYSDDRHSDLEELSENNDLRGDWTLQVPSLREGRRKELSLTIKAPTTPDRYYYGALLPSNIHDTDYTGDLTEEALTNNLAREERVEVTSSPDFIVESISVRETTLDSGEEFTLRATVLNQGLGEPQETPTLRYYLSSDVRISVNDKEVGEDRVSRLDTDETGNESISLTAPTEPGVYFYGACVQRIENESNTSNNCSAAVAITVRNIQPVGVIAPLAGDVNTDGVVNIQDLVLVAASFEKTGENIADINKDGVVDILDLVLVASAFGNTASAPFAWSRDFEKVLTTADLQTWLTQAQQLNLTDTTSQRGILFLEQLLAALTPKETILLANYPNPFNPETWMPYQLAKPADVTLTIYSINGQLVRQLALGHQPAGIYQNRSRAAYWDGKNVLGESVASGVYFYVFSAGEFKATRKMLLRK